MLAPLLSAALACLATQQPPAADLTRAQMLEDLAVLEAGVTRAWPYLDDKREHSGVDVEALVDELRAELPEHATRRAFAEQLEQLVAALQDGHGGLRSPDLADRYRSWPIDLLDAKEGVLVRRVHPSATGRVTVGDRLLAVDGVPVEEHLAAVARRTMASSDHGRRAFALSHACATAAETLRLELEGADGARRTVLLETLADDGDEPEVLRWRWVTDEVGVLRVPTFAVGDWGGWLAASKDRPEDRERWLADAEARLDEAFAELADARALVLDLRGNTGGTDWLGIHLARHLLEPGFTYFQLRTRWSPEWRAALEASGVDASRTPTEGWSPPYAERPGDDAHGGPPIAPWSGPLWILVDSTCFSTCDNLVACLADQRPAVRVVGRTTHGGTGGPRTVARLPHSGAEVRLCLQQVRRPSGELIEGRGTAPDVAVRWTRADLLAGRDPDLEAALAEVRAALERREDRTP